MITFRELYAINARWHDKKILVIFIGRDSKELLIAKQACKKYGNYIVSNFENDWVILKKGDE